MKRLVICPLCKKDLGSYHSNASTKPLRDHIYIIHPKDYKKIVKLVSEIDDKYDELKKYGVSHWSKFYFHNNVDFERELKTQPSLTEEQREKLLKNILSQDE